ncbi:hypothetical protein [Cardiobacterium hominis]|uniref:hypothetical protein n=1 Tax=Cardiobacterium hominis TaxID=2718 RepID=UPI0028D2EAA8|nr:hypothetical protein [Cardiobacterium hominis]
MVFFLFSERVAPLVAGLGRGNIVKAAGGVNLYVGTNSALRGKENFAQALGGDYFAASFSLRGAGFRLDRTLSSFT